MYNYFKQYNCIYLLYDCPEYLKHQDKVHYNGTGVTSKGLRRTNPIKVEQIRLIKNWLNSPYETSVTNENNIEEVVTKQLLYTIDSPALIEELVGYYDKANVDRICALGMALIAREQFKEEGMDMLDDEKLASADKNYFYNNDFFDKMYNKRLSSAAKKQLMSLTS